MKFVSILLLSTLLISCSGKIIPLKGSYPSTPFQYETTKSKDEVWDNLIDLFAQEGISIKIIDRSSGLIISDNKTKLSATYEDKNGNLKDPNAYAVAPVYYNPGPRKYYYPKTATGEWNVRIKESNGKTIINVNLLNIEVDYGVGESTSAYSFLKKFTLSGRSISNFEKLIANTISN